MGRDRRVTLRCIDHDLHQDWVESSDQLHVRELRAYLDEVGVVDAAHSHIGSLLRRVPPLARLRHPLIQAFDVKFSSGDEAGVLRESISSVSDRQWLKQSYSARWRGAAVITTRDETETAWLGAAGYHREDSVEDFYEWFASECGSGSDQFMPTAEDELVATVDKKISRLDAWKLQLHLTSLVLLSNAISTGSAGPVRVPKPEDKSVHVANLSITVETIEEGDEVLKEVTVVIDPAGWAHSGLANTATRTILAAIEPRAESWMTAPLTGTALSHSCLLQPAIEEEANEAAVSGYVARTPGDIRLGSVAHFARKSGLTSATVEGQPVQAICGYWFVPLHDHVSLDVCTTCASVHEQMPE